MQMRLVLVCLTFSREGCDSQSVFVSFLTSLHTALLGLCTGLTLLVPDNSATDMLTSLMSRHATSLLPALLTQLMSSQVGLLLLSGLMTL